MHNIYENSVPELGLRNNLCDFFGALNVVAICHDLCQRIGKGSVNYCGGLPRPMSATEVAV